jgi:hypothetical protein
MFSVNKFDPRLEPGSAHLSLEVQAGSARRGEPAPSVAAI